MRERATLIGAQLQIDPGPSGDGTRLRLMAPIEDAS
jgi:signal transduction histidine kinase